MSIHRHVRNTSERLIVRRRNFCVCNFLFSTETYCRSIYSNLLQKKGREKQHKNKSSSPKFFHLFLPISPLFHSFFSLFLFFFSNSCWSTCPAKLPPFPWFSVNISTSAHVIWYDKCSHFSPYLVSNLSFFLLSSNIKISTLKRIYAMKSNLKTMANDFRASDAVID